MRIAWLGLAAAAAVLAVSSCGAFGLVGVAALAAWSDGPLFPLEPSRFRVGGTIQGLSGSVVLELNEAESLVLSQDGPFVFEGPLADRSPFEVRVLEVPPEQQCAVESAQGVVHGRNVTSIQVSCGPRMYWLGGTVTDLNGQLELSINGNPPLVLTASGPFRFQTQLPKGHGYGVTVVKQPRGQECSISGESGTVAGDVDTIAMRCRAYFKLVTHQAAGRVVGQTDFDLRKIPAASEIGLTTMLTPWGNPVMVGGMFYVADRESNRILVFNGLPTWKSNASAAFVLGQPDSQSTAPHGGQDGFHAPEGLSSDGRYLAVADRGNHRVLVYGTLPTGTHARPARVFGQPAFDTPSHTACDDRTLGLPSGVFIGYGRLIVADYLNQRVMIWMIPDGDLPPSGKAADLVLGQRSFTSCAPNDSDGDRVQDLPSASTLSFPEGIWTDGKRLVIADTGNNRVLVWKEFPTTHGQPADYVLGQAGFTTRSKGTSPNRMDSPRGIASTGEQLFVADSWNNRVLVWDPFPTATGAAAERVLGQLDLNSSAQQDSPSSTSLNGPTGVLLATPDLVVTDSGNNRVLIYESR